MVKAEVNLNVPHKVVVVEPLNVILSCYFLKKKRKKREPLTFLMSVWGVFFMFMVFLA